MTPEMRKLQIWSSLFFDLIQIILFLYGFTYFIILIITGTVHLNYIILFNHSKIRCTKLSYKLLHSKVSEIK
jgi:hypothetical protein